MKSLDETMREEIDQEILGDVLVPTRPSFHDILMQMAVLVSKRSTCLRLKVGAVISSTDFRKVLAMGYNGNATGLPNTCDSDEPGKCGCLHAEENAVINCDVPRQVEKIVFCTHLPCVMCAKRLINLGNVKQIVYLNDYRIRDSLVLLSDAGIRTESMAAHRVNDVVDRWHDRSFLEGVTLAEALHRELGFTEAELALWRTDGTVPARLWGVTP